MTSTSKSILSSYLKCILQKFAVGNQTPFLAKGLFHSWYCTGKWIIPSMQLNKKGKEKWGHCPCLSQAILGASIEWLSWCQVWDLHSPQKWKGYIAALSHKAVFPTLSFEYFAVSQNIYCSVEIMGDFPPELKGITLSKLYPGMKSWHD